MSAKFSPPSIVEISIRPAGFLFSDLEELTSELGVWGNDKSDIADLKNLGPAEAGSITAGKFLENFTDYPYIHLDIAGPAFLEKRDSYRGQGGTGVGVRLLFDYIKRKIQ